MLHRSVDFSSRNRHDNASPQGSMERSPRKIYDYSIELPSLVCVNYNPVEERSFRENNYTASPTRISKKYRSRGGNDLA
jgi:hypothetical protein